MLLRSGAPKSGKSKRLPRFAVEGKRWPGESKLVENCRESVERCRAPKESGGALEALHTPTLTMQRSTPCIVKDLPLCEASKIHGAVKPQWPERNRCSALANLRSEHFIPHEMRQFVFLDVFIAEKGRT